MTKLTLLERIERRLATHPRLGRALDNEALEAGLRWCYGCEGLKDLENFYRDRGGYEARCKSCKSAASKKRYRPRPKPCKPPRYPVARKKCSGCSRELEWYRFSARARSVSGLDSRCRLCRSGYYEQHKAEYFERTNHYRKNVNVWAEKLSSGYRRAAQAGAHAEKVTTRELLEYWQAHGIAADTSVYSGEALGPGLYSLDHVIPLSDPNGPGHVVSNLVPCLVHENSRKANQHFVMYLGDVHADS